MKLTRIKLHHFRGIKDASIDLGDIIAFVGENNAGKSSALRALNSFFHPTEELPNFISGSHLYSTNSIPKITLTFTLSDGEALGAALQALVDSKNQLHIQATFKKSNKAISYKVLRNRRWEDFGSSLFQDLKTKIDFLFIPPVRDHSTIVGTEQAILKKIVSQFLVKHTAKSDRVSPLAKEAAKKLEGTVFKKISKEIQRLYFLEKRIEFSIGFPEDLDYRHILHGFNLEILDQGMKFRPEDCGSGVQSLTLIALYRYLARLKETRYILAIEEPESNLHPQAQREVVETLRESVADENGEGIQVLLTTHSTVIVDALSHEDLVLCRRKPNSNRGFNIELSQVGADFWTKNGLSDVKAHNFFKLPNSEVFFCRHVIVCEGPTDSEVIECLAEQEKIDLNRFGVSLINCKGIAGLHYPVALLKELEVPFTVIVDKDFFFPYKNQNKLAESRNGRGFPVYDFKSFYKKYVTVIGKLIPKKNIEEARKLLKSNHSRAMAYLESFGVICFKWNLETDLLNSTTAANAMYDQLELTGPNRNTKFVLVSKSDEIKKSELLVTVISSLDKSGLPNSYKRIRRMLVSIKSGILEQERKIAEAVKQVQESVPDPGVAGGAVSDASLL